MLRKKEIRFGVPGTSGASSSSAFVSRSSSQESSQRQVASSPQPQAASSASTAAPAFGAPAAPVPSVASPVAQQTSGGSQDAPVAIVAAVAGVDLAPGPMAADPPAANGQSGTALGSGLENVSSTSSSCVAPATTAKVAKRHSRATQRVVRRGKEALARASVQVLRLKEQLKEQRVASEEAREWRDVAGGLREALERQEREHAASMGKLEADHAQRMEKLREQHAKSIAEELGRVEEKHAKSIAVEVKRAEEMGKKHAKSIAEESRRAEAQVEEVQMLKGHLEAVMAGNAGKLQEGLMAKAFRRAQDAVAAKSKTVLEQAERIASYERQLKDAIGALDAAGISNGVISRADYIRESAAAMIDQDKVIVLLDNERKALRAGLEESEGKVKSLEYGKRVLQGTLDIADGEKTEALARTKVLEAKLEKAETRAAFSLPGSFPSECFCGGQQGQVADEEEVTPSDGASPSSAISHLPWALVSLFIWLTFVSWVLFKPSDVDGSSLASTTVAGVSASCSVLVAATTSFVTSRYSALVSQTGSFFNR
ncbi:hypothetical protein LZ554_006715 [Drepanopeziza brunnea f. sp. 'monogermtubi']|nr:hypothetical protein LZ554_006715 [Drepanopeziza brunnea f. sp. 'monogermtubi']